MSGGSLDYAYCKVSDAANTIMGRSRNPLHLAFAKHLMRVSEALHDLEWVYSDDCSSPQEEESIRLVLRPGDELESATEEANTALANLNSAIERAKKIQKNG